MNSIDYMIAICVLAALVGVILVVLGAALGSVVYFVGGMLGRLPVGSREPAVYTPARPQVPPALRRAVLERDGYRCVVCGSDEDLELDHEIALSKGGATTYENLRVLCHTHNAQKGAS